MAVGKMQHRLALQSPSRTTDGGGSGRTTFSTIATVWGRIEAKGGAERFFGDQNEGRTTHTITIRFRRNITIKNRIVYQFTSDNVLYTRTFNIKRVENKNERDKYLELFCEEGVAT
jgi:SPP1 family predicted phage head-tail adaptor|tara:strand:+ start:133 stop:480 length:348 start_codon:yes stop_codon:yes gene_type:complete